MNQNERQALEDKIHDLWIVGDFNGAITAALQDGYGREIFEFFLARHRREVDAKEVFSDFSEQLCRSVRRFSWASSFRTWAYVLAVRASRRYAREMRDRVGRTAALPENSSVSFLRQKTPSALETELRPSFVKLRNRLQPEDQALLMLRVERELEWKDLARVLNETEADMDDEALERMAVRLRKRFQLLVNYLRELARREGLASRHQRFPRSN